MALGDSDSRFGGSELSTGVGGGNFGTGPGGIAASNEGSGEDEQRPGASGFNLTTTILGAIPGAMLGGPIGLAIGALGGYFGPQIAEGLINSLIGPHSSTLNHDQQERELRRAIEDRMIRDLLGPVFRSRAGTFHPKELGPGLAHLILTSSPPASPTGVQISRRPKAAAKHRRCNAPWSTSTRAGL